MPLSAALAQVLGTAIPAVMGVAQSAINNSVDSENLRKQQNHADLQAKIAYAQNLASERRAVGRELPGYKLANLRAAGINPSLQDLNGLVGSNPVQQPSFNPAETLTPHQSAWDVPITESFQLGLNLHAQQNADRITEARLALMDSQTFFNYIKSDLTNQQIEALAQNMGIDLVRLNLDVERNEREWQRLSMDEKRLDSALREAEARIGLTEEQTKKIMQDTKLSKAQLERIYALLPAEVANMNADTALKYAQQSLYQQQESQSLAFTAYLFGKNSREERMFPYNVANTESKTIYYGERSQSEHNLRWTRGVTSGTAAFKNVCSGAADVVRAISSLKNPSINVTSGNSAGNNPAYTTPDYMFMPGQYE